MMMMMSTSKYVKVLSSVETDKISSQTLH